MDVQMEGSRVCEYAYEGHWGVGTWSQYVQNYPMDLQDTTMTRELWDLMWTTLAERWDHYYRSWEKAHGYRSRGTLIGSLIHKSTTKPAKKTEAYNEWINAVVDFSRTHLEPVGCQVTYTHTQRQHHGTTGNIRSGYYQQKSTTASYVITLSVKKTVAVAVLPIIAQMPAAPQRNSKAEVSGGPPARAPPPLEETATVVKGYTAESATELSCKAGDVVTVLESAPSGWSKVRLNDASGWVPTAFLKK